MFNNIAEEYKGQKLYKYYSYNKDMCKMLAPILYNTLRFTKCDNLNDPYDCYIASNKNKSMRNSLMETVYVCSFTRNFDDILMWSHYATNHKGFVVEYDVDSLRKINEVQIEYFSSVEYSNEIIHYDSDDAIITAIFHKAKCWEYEKEVRAAYYGSPKGNEIIKDIILPNDSIFAIYLGSQFIASQKGKIPFLLKEWNEQGKLFYMQMQSDQYKLKPKNDFRDSWFCDINKGKIAVDITTSLNISIQK